MRKRTEIDPSRREAEGAPGTATSLHSAARAVHGRYETEDVPWVREKMAMDARNGAVRRPYGRATLPATGKSLALNWWGRSVDGLYFILFGSILSLMQNLQHQSKVSRA